MGVSGCESYGPNVLTLGLALVDALAGVWLIQYALRREHRDKARVAVVGGVLLVRAAALLWLELVVVGDRVVVEGPARHRPD